MHLPLHAATMEVESARPIATQSCKATDREKYVHLHLTSIHLSLSSS